MKREFMITVMCMALLAFGCNPAPHATLDNREVDAAAIRQADEAWSKVAEAKQLENHLGYFVDDAVVLASNEPIVLGKEAIRRMLTEFYGMPGFAVKWQSNKVEVALSGDLGYSMGNYELSLNDSTGKPMTDRGKYVTVWKKQADESWKVAVDMFNSDLPLPK